jgi:hypothetical protein
MRLELNVGSKGVAKGNMVVDLSIHSKNNLPIFAEQWLRTGVCAFV